jgi:hypothetical protein
MTRSDHEARLARSGDEAGEDAMTARIGDATDAKLVRGEDVALPAAVWKAIEGGEHPIQLIRSHPHTACTSTTPGTALIAPAICGDTL